VHYITRNIVIPDEMYSKLEQISKEQGISIAAVIKIACSEYIKKLGK
jgi:predicted DNA-binding protein